MRIPCVSYTIRSKLYAPFLEENIRKLHSNYPTFDDVLANANEITKLLSHRERYIGNKLKTVDSVKHQPKDKIKNFKFPVVNDNKIVNSSVEIRSMETS